MAETEPAVVAGVHSAADAKSKAKKPAVKKPKAARNYPSFEVMISDAIVALKERTGSSQIAITKYIEDKQKNLPPNFRKMLLFRLKRLVAAEKLVKVKASFKLPPTRSSSSSATAAAPAAKKPAAAAKPKTTAAKPNAATTKVVVKPKAKTAAKPKAKAAALTKVKPSVATAKPAGKAQPKRKAAAAVAAPKPAAKKAAKVAKTVLVTSPGKKKVAAKPKKVAAKPKSVKSPIKKAAGTKRTRK